MPWGDFHRQATCITIAITWPTGWRPCNDDSASSVWHDKRHRPGAGATNNLSWRHDHIHRIHGTGRLTYMNGWILWWIYQSMDPNQKLWMLNSHVGDAFTSSHTSWGFCIYCRTSTNWEKEKTKPQGGYDWMSRNRTCMFLSGYTLED